MENKPENIASDALSSTSVSDKSIWDYFVLCVTEKYFCFEGRARRKEYWSFVLCHFLIMNFLTIISDFLNSAGGSSTSVDLSGTLLSIALIIPGLAVLCRRLHDVNFSGWWVGAPILGVSVMGFIFGYLQATSGEHEVDFHFDADFDAMQVSMIVAVIACVISWLIIAVVVFFKSDMKTNKYGPVPEGVK